MSQALPAAAAAITDVAVLAEDLIPDQVQLLANMPVDRKLRQCPSAQYLGALQSDKSRRTMSSHLNKVAQLFGVPEHSQFQWELLDADVVDYIRRSFADDGLAPNTINALLCAVRGTTKKAFQMQMMAHENYDRIKLVQNLKATRVASRRVLTTAEIRMFLAACDDNTFKGLRDSALFALVVGCGLRRSEAINIELKHMDLASGEIIITGKGNKQRPVWMTDITQKFMDEYIRELRGRDPGYLIVRMKSNDDPMLRSQKSPDSVPGIAPDSVNDIFKSRGLEGNMESFKPHDLRRTFATQHLDDGTDIRLVSRLLGHANVATTTQAYDFTEDNAARDAAKGRDFY